MHQLCPRGEAKVTSVLVVDDEALVRTGLEMILNTAEDIRVVGTCGSDEAVEQVRALHPDVVLIDIGLSRDEGLEILSQLPDDDPKSAIAILSTVGTEELFEAALAHGASGFLLKDTDPTSLIRAVRVLADGSLVLAPGVARTHLLRPPPNRPGRRAPPLSSRQTQVVRRLADGQTNAQIARGLGKSVGTIKDDVSSIFAAFGVTTRVEAALVAVRHGLLRDL